MKWLIEDLYTLIPFDPSDFDLYDLYYLLKTPAKVSFRFAGKEYTVEALNNPDGFGIHFGNRWYRDAGEFMYGAAIGDQRLVTIYNELYGFMTEE